MIKKIKRFQAVIKETSYKTFVVLADSESEALTKVLNGDFYDEQLIGTEVFDKEIISAKEIK
jgi:ribosomal 30S subunit maturation factor RimM